MKMIKVIKADKKQKYTFDQLSKNAKQNVIDWIAENDFNDQDYWNDEFQRILSTEFKSYEISINDLNINWDSYERASVGLKQGKIWPAFKTILVDCAKQVLKDLPTFQNKSETLDDWAAEAASDMYWDNGYFTFYSGLSDIDGYDGYQLSEKIADLCNNAYEEKIEPILENISHTFTAAVSNYNDMLYSEQYAKEVCDANEYLFDENGYLLH